MELGGINMNSTDIFNLIGEIRNTSSTNEKSELIKQNIKDDNFRKVLEYTYNPSKIYGIVPDSSWGYGISGLDDFDNSVIDLLDNLIARKLTGNAARDALLQKLSSLNYESSQLLIQIIRKDFRAGFSGKIINKAWKDLIPEYSYMRCSLLKNSNIDKFDFEKGIYSQCKKDGMFTNGNMLENLQFTSRSGSVFPMEHFKEISDSVSHINGLQTHGELLVEYDGKILPRKTGNGILNSVLKGGSFPPGHIPIYCVWDIIPIEYAKRKGKYDVHYEMRLKTLENLFKDNKYIRIIEYKMCYSLKECIEHSNELIAAGEEGTIVKNPVMIWEDGTSKDQIKIKLEFESDLEITGIIPGKVDTKYEGRPGAISCRSSCGKLTVNLVIKNEDMRDRIEADHSDWIGRIVPVLANELMQSSDGAEEYSLFLPRLAEDQYRLDKNDADDVVRIKEIIDSLIKGK